MKIVNIIGGLGNQMFQYALAVKLQQMFPQEEIRVFIGAFRGYGLHNGYEVERIFGARFAKASVMDVARVYWPIFNYRCWQVANRFLPERRGVRENSMKAIGEADMRRAEFFDGYFQRSWLFADARKAILETFRFPELTGDENRKALEFICQGPTVAIHVRRGDYLKDQQRSSICSPAYYSKAIAYVKERVEGARFLVFSDDIEWCKATFRDELAGSDAMYVNWNLGEESYRDMQLMSLCNHNIIANSSFSWWGAWLNRHEDKIVVCPERWYAYSKGNDEAPEEWVKISGE